MDVQLILQRNGKPIWTARLQRSQVTLGRAFGCNVRVPASDVSRLHCRLHIDNGLVVVEDLESINGTFVNGARVRDTEIARPGDRLSLGSVTFVIEYELSAEARERLGIEDDAPLVEAADDVEVVEDSGAAPVVEAVAEPLEEAEEMDADAFVFEDAEEFDLSGSGGDLHGLLSELDDTEDRSKRSKE